MDGHPTDDQTLARLRVLLGLLKRVAETPLNATLDGDGLASLVLAGDPSAWTGVEWGGLEAELDAELVHAIADTTPQRAPPQPGSGDPPRSRARHPLGRWLERTHARLRAVHASAVEVAALRAEGWDDRDIAERLGLGRVLVGRVRHDAAAAIGGGP